MAHAGRVEQAGARSPVLDDTALDLAANGRVGANLAAGSGHWAPPPPILLPWLLKGLWLVGAGHHTWLLQEGRVPDNSI